MNRGLRNNNPGNIRTSPTKYEGERCKSSDTVFKQFESMQYGYRAMFMLLYTYQKRYHLNTLRQMITRYAPPQENHTHKYIETVSGWAGVSPDSKITATCRDVMVPIVAAMSRMENGAEAVMSDVESGWSLFINSLT